MDIGPYPRVHESHHSPPLADSKKSFRIALRKIHKVLEDACEHFGRQTAYWCEESPPLVRVRCEGEDILGDDSARSCKFKKFGFQSIIGSDVVREEAELARASGKGRKVGAGGGSVCHRRCC